MAIFGPIFSFSDVYYPRIRNENGLITLGFVMEKKPFSLGFVM